MRDGREQSARVGGSGGRALICIRALADGPKWFAVGDYGGDLLAAVPSVTVRVCGHGTLVGRTDCVCVSSAARSQLTTEIPRWVRNMWR